METNQKQSQELPAQNIIAIEPKQQSYDTLKAARIAETLRELLDPEYILLFGKLADGTPHSDILAYDLLVVTDGPTHYSWYDAKRYLKMKLPYIGHGAPYINLYIYTRQYLDANNTSFFYFVTQGGNRIAFPQPKDCTTSRRIRFRLCGIARDEVCEHLYAVGRQARGLCGTESRSGSYPRICVRNCTSSSVLL